MSFANNVNVKCQQTFFLAKVQSILSSLDMIMLCPLTWCPVSNLQEYPCQWQLSAILLAKKH